MKVNTATRLKQIMSERNLKQVDIIRLTEPYQNKLGIKMGKSTLSQYINGIQNPDQDRIYLLSKTLDVSEPWLMGYDVPKERTPDGDRNSIPTTTLSLVTETTAKLEESRQKTVLKTAQCQLQEQEKENNQILGFPKKELDKQNKADQNQQKLSEFELHKQKKVVCGRSTAAGGPIDGDCQDCEASNMILDQREVPTCADEIVTIAGDSMEPTLHEGDQVFIHWTPVVEQGEIAVVSINDIGVTCKKVYWDNKNIILRSINETYDDMIYPIDEVRIIGKVL